MISRLMAAFGYEKSPKLMPVAVGGPAIAIRRLKAETVSSMSVCRDVHHWARLKSDRDNLGDWSLDADLTREEIGQLEAGKNYILMVIEEPRP